MFQRAFIEQLGARKFGREETLVREECERLGIEVVPYLAKHLMRGQLPLSQNTFICGDITAMHRAMKQLGIEVPRSMTFQTRCSRGCGGGSGAVP